MIITTASISAIIGERAKRRRFNLKTIGRSIMASRGGRTMSRGGKKKKKKSTRGGRKGR